MLLTNTDHLDSEKDVSALEISSLDDPRFLATLTEVFDAEQASAILVALHSFVSSISGSSNTCNHKEPSQRREKPSKSTFSFPPIPDKDGRKKVHQMFKGVARLDTTTEGEKIVVKPCKSEKAQRWPPER